MSEPNCHFMHGHFKPGDICLQCGYAEPSIEDLRRALAEEELKTTALTAQAQVLRARLTVAEEALRNAHGFLYEAIDHVPEGLEMEIQNHLDAYEKALSGGEKP